MSKIVIITGLTGSGKSGLAVDIAKKYNNVKVIDLEEKEVDIIVGANLL